MNSAAERVKGMQLVDEPAEGAVAKAMAVLEAFRDENAALGVRAAARKVGLPPSTVHRLLGQMEAAGFLEREGRQYRISLKLFEIGNYAAFCEPGGMRDTALPFLSDMFSKGGDCVVTFGVLNRDRILCVEKIRGHLSPRTESRVGHPLPATNSSLGKAILANISDTTLREFLEQGLQRSTEYSIDRPDRLIKQLAEIRRTGIATDQQESILGLSGVAAPVFTQGNVVAGIAITYRSAEFHMTRATQLIKAAAMQLGVALDRAKTRKAYVPLRRIN